MEFDEVAVLGALLMTKYSETLIGEAIGFEDELYGWSNSKTIYYPLSFKANDNIYSVHIELKKPNSITVNFEGEKIQIDLNGDHIELNDEKIKLDFKEGKYATGRRKKSVAKVWLKKGSGKFYVNGKSLNDYFPRANHVMQILRPFEIINQSTDYDVRSKVVGGGQTGQAGALVHGISRALLKFDETLKSTLRKEKLTTRDSRSVERKKPGRAKARKSYQFSKR